MLEGGTDQGLGVGDKVAGARPGRSRHMEERLEHPGLRGKWKGHEEIEWTQLSNEDKKARPEKANVEGRRKQGGIVPNRSPILLPESGGHGQY